MSASPRIIGFYSGSGVDDRGRRLGDIRRWSDDRLEAVHDYIQWLFPLMEPSPVNPGAPVLDRDTIELFRQTPELQSELRASFLRMLTFYGLELRDGQVAQARNFAARARNWLNPGNHNHLRITRILKCVTLLGLEQEARAFQGALAAIYRERPDAISARTWEFWTAAVSLPEVVNRQS